MTTEINAYIAIGIFAIFSGLFYSLGNWFFKKYFEHRLDSLHDELESHIEKLKRNRRG
jgi:hypothetical protein